MVATTRTRSAKPATRKPAARKTASRKPAAEVPAALANIDWADTLASVLNTPGQLGNTYNRFHHYSFLNTVLLQAQGVHEPVASYNRWKALGRQVQKGTSAAWINRPIIIRVDKDTPDEKAITKFKFVKGAHLYSSTEGEELPAYVAPTWDRSRALSKLDITEIAFDMIDGNVQGYSTGREFAINPMAVYPFKTMIHELAHIVLGHTTGNGDEHRGVQEFQAETVAYLVMSELGATDQFDSAESRAYVQGWLAGDKPSDRQITGVFSAVEKILTAGYPVRETDSE